MPTAPSPVASGVSNVTKGFASGPLSGTKPTGATTVGQIMIAAVAAQGTQSTPAGWNLRSAVVTPSSLSHGIYWRAFQVGDTGPWTFFNASGSAVVDISTWENIDTTTPIEAIQSATDTSFAGTVTGASVTTLGPDRTIFRTYANEASGTFNAIGGWTELFDTGINNSGSDAWVAGIYAGQPTQGASGTRVGTFTGSSFERVAWAMSLAPVAGVAYSATDPLGLLDSTTYQKGNLQTNPLGLTDSRKFAQGKVRTDAAGLSDSIEVVHIQPAEWVGGYFAI